MMMTMMMMMMMVMTFIISVARDCVMLGALNLRR